MNKLPNEIRELNIDELDAVTGGGGDASGPGLGGGTLVTPSSKP